MKRRTTIELDDELLARAKRALGATTTRATVEEALRLATEAAEDDKAHQAERQQQFLGRLRARIDVGVLASEEMWR